MNALLLLHGIPYMPDNVRQQNTPRARFIAALRLPEADLERAVQPSIRNPCAEHLNGVFVLLGSMRNYEGIHFYVATRSPRFGLIVSDPQFVSTRFR